MTPPPIGRIGGAEPISMRKANFFGSGWMRHCAASPTIKKSMNDFCLAFHGGPGGEPQLKTYTFDDVVATLNSLAPYDWAGFLRARLDGVATKTPMEAIENGGWKLVYTEEPNTAQETKGDVKRIEDMGFTVGMTVVDDGTITDVIHDGPSYKAGLGPGMKIVAVDGSQYSPEEMTDAIKTAKSSSEPIRLIAASGAHYQNFSIDYHKGMLYPHLVRDNSRPDYISEILHPMAPVPGAAQ